MTDKELIRRALLGSWEAQQECTEKGIVLPCPFCGNEYPAITDGQGYGIEIKCQHCNITFSRDFYGYGRAKERCRSVTLGAWNTRPAPPVGRCENCKFYTVLGHCKVHSQEPDQHGSGAYVEMLPDDFCSYFEPKED